MSIERFAPPIDLAFALCAVPPAPRVYSDFNSRRVSIDSCDPCPFSGTIPLFGSGYFSVENRWGRFLSAIVFVAMETSPVKRFSNLHAYYLFLRRCACSSIYAENQKLFVMLKTTRKTPKTRPHPTGIRTQCPKTCLFSHAQSIWLKTYSPPVCWIRRPSNYRLGVSFTNYR